ncbi:peptidoglycan-binding protein [Candidatus Parcubacteria bacterium]|nr:peptidoglycan-binding protein [Candidatus Parcubacteria bacterium]
MIHITGFYTLKKFTMKRVLLVGVLTVSMIAPVLPLPDMAQAQTPTTTVQPSTCVNITRTLARGVRGTDVSQLQIFLKAQSHFPQATPLATLYGAVTETAVKKFQARYSISQTGTVGPLTRAKIQQLSCGGIVTASTVCDLPAVGLKLNSRGNDVIKLQTFLRSQGDFTYPSYTTNFGPVTQTALRKYQQRKNLAVTGVLDASTLANIKNVKCPVTPTAGSVVTIPGTSPAVGGGGGGSAGASGVSKKYTINANADIGGSISPGGTLSVDDGTSQTFSIAPSTDYQIDQVLVDGTSIGAASSYTFSSVTTNRTITAKFKKKPTQPINYTIAATAGVGGSITPTGSISVTSGGSQTFTISPNTGFQIQVVTVDGSSAGAPGVYTFSNITGNHTISATFTQIPVPTYSVTATASTGGTISPSGTNTVNQGTSATYIITPNLGFQVQSVVVDGVNKGSIQAYTFPNTTTGSHTISATFSPVTSTYTITASAGTGGSISPAGTVSVNQGGSQTFTITPASGYQTSQVMVNGVNQGVIPVYTFNNVQNNATISATFVPITYTITASAGANGTISPLGTITINSGQTQNITVTPDPGYQTTSVLINGVAQTIATTYSFTTISQNHTISATFELIPVIPTPAPTPTPVPQTGTDLYYVATTGSDTNDGRSSATAWRTLKKAADTIPAGATVIVASGNYTGFSTSRSGTATARKIFSAQLGATINVGTSASDGINLEGASYITIEGFTIVGMAHTGIRSVQNTGVIIRNNTVDQTAYVAILTGFSDNVLVEGNTTSNGKNGIYIGNTSDNPIVRGNTVFNNTKNGIHMNGDVSLGGRGTIVNALIENNVVSTSNTVDGGGALNMDGVLNSRIQNNLFYNNRGQGIVLFKGDSSSPSINNVLVNNTIVGSRLYNFSARNGSTGNKLFNNIFYNDSTFGSTGSILVAGDSLTGFQSNYNIVVNKFEREGAASNLTLAQWQSQTGQDLNSIIVGSIAEFADASNKYHLTSSSPGINTGVSSFAGISAPAYDKENVARPVGSAHDIGTYEFGGTPTTPIPTPVPTPTPAPIPPPPTSGAFAIGDRIEATSVLNVRNAGSGGTLLGTQPVGAQGTIIAGPVAGSDGFTRWNVNFDSGIDGWVADDFFIKAGTTPPPTGTFTITATAGVGGTISPNGSVTVASGGSQTFTITPATGYQVATVVVDGVNQGPISSYPFSNVTSNRTISATFSQVTTQPPTTPGGSGPISNVVVSNITSTAATVTWTTAEAMDTQVRYGVTPSTVSRTLLDTALVTSHTANMITLMPSSTYYYTVRSKNAAGTLYTYTGTFTTPAGATVARNTYYVSTTGNDANLGTSDAGAWRTLLKAAKTVQPGDTVIVRPGTYVGFYLEKGGWPGAPITFKADPGVIINTQAYNNDGINILKWQNGGAVELGYINIEGFEIINMTHAGIMTTSNVNGVFKNNTIRAAGYVGILTSYSDYITVENNKIYNSDNGIYIGNTSIGPIVRRNLIDGGLLSASKNGIHMNGDLSVGGTSGSTGLITNALIEENIIYRTGVQASSGINMDGVQNSIIRNNLVWNVRSNGISFYQIDGGGPSKDNVLVNNTVVGSRYYNLNIKNNATGIKAFNNILYNDSSYGTRGSILVAADSRTGFESDYNTVVNIFNLDKDEQALRTFTQWKAETGQDSHSVLVTSASSLFANYIAANDINNDYHLKSTSPAVNAGISSLGGGQAASRDLDGVSRPYGGAFDIGAYEFTGTQAPPPGDTTAPSAPTNLSASAVSTSQINLTWTASTDSIGVTSYRVFRNGSQIATPSGTLYSDIGLNAGTQYMYYIVAVDAACNVSTQSSSASATTQAATTPTSDTTAPTVPANVSASAVSSSQITISWTASTDAVGVTGYRVFRNSSQVGTPSGTSYSDTGLSASTQYSYTVAAVDAAGNVSAQSSSASATTQAASGGTPPSSSPTLISAGSVWKYLDNGTNQGTAWTGISFSDSSWSSGAAQLGYGDGDEATVVSYGSNSSQKYITTYFRNSFNVSNPGSIAGLTLKIIRDDAAVVYLNGTEIFRDNVPAGAVGYQTRAVGSMSGTNETTWLQTTVSPSLLLSGTNVIAVEIHQDTPQSSDISFDLSLVSTLALNNFSTQLASPLLALIPQTNQSQTVVSRSACTVIMNRLTLGSTDGTTNNEVSILQNFLKTRGYYTYSEITGYFGKSTEEAVKRFQIRWGIDPVGIVGPRTQQQIHEVDCDA